MVWGLRELNQQLQQQQKTQQWNCDKPRLRMPSSAEIPERTHTNHLEL